MNIVKSNTRIAITSMSSIAPTWITIDEIWKNQINWNPAFIKIDELSYTFSKLLKDVLTSDKEYSLLKSWLTEKEAITTIRKLMNKKGYLPVKIKWEISKWWNILKDKDIIQEIMEEINKTPFNPKLIYKISSLLNKGKFDTSILQSIYMSIVSLNNANLLWENWVSTGKIGINFGSWFAGSRNIEWRWIFAWMVSWNKTTTWPRFLVASLPNMPAPVVANILWIKGQTTSDYSACASSLFAISWAIDQILLDRVEVALAGGCDSSWDSFFNLLAFGRMGALARWYEENPELASYPFLDSVNPKWYKWFVLWDWGWIFTFENLEKAKDRGADLLWEVLGIGLSNCNPIRENLPLSSGTIEWQSLAMQQSLDIAWINAKEFKNKWWVIFAHGTGTEVGDKTEAKAIYNIFGAWVDVTAVKSVIWHSLGWSGAQSLAIALKSFEEKTIPWTLHYSDERKMSTIPKWVNIIWKNTKRDLKLILINAFWFWWHNASLLIKNI